MICFLYISIYLFVSIKRFAENFVNLNLHILNVIYILRYKKNKISTLYLNNTKYSILHHF